MADSDKFYIREESEEEGSSSTMSSMLGRDLRCDFSKFFSSFSPNNGQS